MFPRLLSLLAAGLLLGTSGCITEPEMATGTGSYQLDGVVKTCAVQSDVSNPVVQNQPYDQLDIQLLTNPEPATGPEIVFLTFTKPQGQPVANYQLKTMRYRATGGPEATYTLNTVTLQEAKGAFAGTFAGVAPAASSVPPLVITAGTFAGTRP